MPADPAEVEADDVAARLHDGEAAALKTYDADAAQLESPERAEVVAAAHGLGDPRSRSMHRPYGAGTWPSAGTPARSRALRSQPPSSAPPS